MSDEVPAQITLYPPSTDVECSCWDNLAPTLWHSGLIWHDYEQVVFESKPVELRLWCTFTDRYAFNTWREHELVMTRCPEILASRIEAVEVLTPWDRHDKLCKCNESSELVLRNHGFGNRKSVLYCCDCLGYYPNYRTSELAGDIDPRMQTWALIFGHVHKIWLLTNELEAWAFNELQSPGSELNSAGRALARELTQRLGKSVWYDLFAPVDSRTNVCPSCQRECSHPEWSNKRFVCILCGLVY
jgi:hypothetical protein